MFTPVARKLTVATLIAVFSFFPYGQYMFESFSIGFLDTPVAQADPGGVNTSLSLWVKADDGTATNALWEDLSGNDHDLTAIALQQPTLTVNAINFNPAFDFNGSANEFVNTGSPYASGDALNTNLFIVEAHDTPGGSLWGFSDSPGNVNDKFHAHYPRDPNGENVFFDVRTANAGDRVAGTYPFVPGQPTIGAFYNATANQEVQVNGTSVAQDAAGQAQASSITRIGSANLGGTTHFDGKIAEVAAYDADLALNDKKQVQSYLALKYGITLDASLNDYLDSAGASVYDLAVGYSNDIVGLARDTGSTIDQRVSKAQTGSSILTLATDADFTSVNGGSRTQLADGLYVVMGHNGGTTTEQVSEVPTGFDVRIEREWRAENTNSAGPINLQFDGFDDRWHLITDADGDFSSDATDTGALSATGAKTNFAVADGQYYTLARMQESPGGVPLGLTLWLKADDGPDTATDGTAVTTWSDRSGNSLDATGQGTTPTYEDDTANRLNFEPTVSFGGAGYFNTSPYTLGSEVSYFYVQQLNAAGANVLTHSPSNFIAEASVARAYHTAPGSATGFPSAATTEPVIRGGTHTLSTAGTIYDNGVETAHTAGSNTNTARPFGIGATHTGSLPIDGRIAEAIVYEADVDSGTQANQIQSYLAVKYGITLDSGDIDYRDNSGSVVWEAVSNTNYKENIFALAQDNASGLNKKISTSINTDTILTAALQNNFTDLNNSTARTVNHATDGEYLFFSSLNGSDSTSTQTNELNPALGFNERLTREWKVNHGGGAGTFTSDVHLQFAGYNSEWHIVGSASTGNMGDASVTDIGPLDANGVISLPIASLPDDFRFTLAKKVIVPGGVGAGLTLWLKANDGTDVTTDGDTIGTWEDKSGNGRDAVQNAGTPAYNENSINFNPAVAIDDGDDLSTINPTLLAQPNTIIGVVKRNTAVSGRYVWDSNDGFNRNFAFNRLLDGTVSLGTASQIGPTGTYSLVNGEQAIIDGLYNGANSALTVNGAQQGAVADANTGGFQDLQIGAQSNGNNAIDADFAEIIVYNSEMTGADEQRVESYLALKYGITIDQSVDTDYLASDGATAMWTNDGDGYESGIFGIGRDDAQALYQKVSQSVTDTAITTVALDNDFTSANNDASRTATTSDLSFLTIAHNDGATTTQQTERSSIYADRVTREWKVDNVGGVGAVNLKFDGFDRQWVLVIDDDGNFSSGSQTNAGNLSATGEIAAVTLSDGDYFTLMRPAVFFEFSRGAGASTNESTNANFASILVNGTLADDADVVLSIFPFPGATNGVDYNAPANQTITIPAGTYDGTAGTAVTLTPPALVDDVVVEGNEQIFYVLGTGENPLQQGDANGDTAFAPSFTYTITDDDTAAIDVVVTDNLTTEDGTDTGEVSVVLQSRPTADVTVTLAILGGDQAEGAFDAGGTLFTTTVGPFTATNWNTPQTVTVFGVDEVVDDGNQTFTVVGQSAASADTNYTLADADIADVLLTNQDDDISDIIVTSVDNVTSEDGDTATVTLTPSSAPTADVVVSVGISDLTEGTITITEVTLPAGSVAPVNIIITGVDDADSDIDIVYQIVFGDPVSGDVNYDALDVGDVAAQNLVNLDNDDSDNDGNPDSIEDAGNNGGDGNGDGIDDADQPEVSAVPNALTGDYTTVQSSGGCTFITQNATVAEGALAAQDPTYEYPVGLVDFQIKCANAGDSADVVIYYGQEYDTNTWTWRKFDSVGLAYSDISTAVTYGTAALGATTVTTASFTVTDGNPATDEDGVADGFINDPSGPGILVPQTSSGGGGGGSRHRCADPAATNYDPDGRGRASDSVCEYVETADERSDLEERIAELRAQLAQLLGQTPSQSSTPITIGSGGVLRQLLGGGEPNVPAEFRGQVCQRYLTYYIWPDRDNNPTEVRKLQTFLNEAYGENLPIDGIYDADDIAAIERYQTKHAPQVLWPWDLTAPTANVYKTTVAKINLEMCALDMNTPYFTEYLEVGDVSLESVRVQDFINLINAPTSGYPTEGLPLTTTYTQETADAVREYQNRYRDTVLDPWGLSQGTGSWYQTTRASANALVNTPEPEVTLDNGTMHSAF